MDKPRDPELRVCIVAENASFQFGGEASLPLHYFTMLRSRGVEAWLVIHERAKRELEALLPSEQTRIIYLADRWFHRLLWSWSAFLPRRLYEGSIGILLTLINQVIQRGIIRSIVRQEGITVIHQPIPVSPRAPSLIAGFGIPVVMGPMNGGMDYPPAFKGLESWSTRAALSLGRKLSSLVNSIVPGKKYAKILLVANPRTRLALPACVQGLVLDLPENGVDLKLWTPLDASRDILPSRPEAVANFVFVGRLVDWKRLDLALDAIAKCGDFTLDVIGDGPMRREWQELAARLGIESRVNFLGWLPQKVCAQRLQSALALILPSIYECGGAVVLEAMAAGIPAIATDWGGPADYIDESCGILIPAADPASISRGFAAAMNKLASDRPLAKKLGASGREKVVREYDWEAKIDHMINIYRQALG